MELRRVAEARFNRGHGASVENIILGSLSLIPNPNNFCLVADGVEDDVDNRVERAAAMSSFEESAEEAVPAQGIDGQKRDRLDVHEMHNVLLCHFSIY